MASNRKKMMRRIIRERALAAKQALTEVVEEVVETLDSPAVTTAKSVNTDFGVTEEPCPEVIGEFPTNADQAKGCIYLGILSDYTGPYGAAGLPVEVGIRSYWAWKNLTGCLGDYCVAVREAADTGYNPQKHLEEYNAMRMTLLHWHCHLERH